MPRFVALLRGVSPQNAKSAELKRAFESAGFANVRTVLSSGNVVFDTRARTVSKLERAAEDALQASMGQTFYTIVRPLAHLEELLAGDPFVAHALPAGAKRVVSFLREPCTPRIPLPYVIGDARVLSLVGREAFSAYVPTGNDPVFMRMIEQAFGKNITTRTWETVRKCSQA